MRIVNIFLRRNAPNSGLQKLRRTEDGTDIFVVTGGLTLVAEAFGRYGTIDVSADNAILWTRVGGAGGDSERGGGDSLQLAQDVDQPLEVYLEGNVVFRQDRREEAGHGDEKLIEAKQFYMDLRRQRFQMLDGEVNQFVADFIAPMRTTGDRIKMFREEFRGPDGKPIFGPERLQADRTMTTGSRFPKPGYRFRSRSVDLTELRPEPLRDPATGAPLGDQDDPGTPQGKRYQIEARQNVFYMGPIPVFYWPRFVTTTDDIDPPLKRITFPGQQRVRPAGPERLERLQAAGDQASQVGRGMERRPRLPELPGRRGRHGIRLFRPRPVQGTSSASTCSPGSGGATSATSTVGLKDRASTSWAPGRRSSTTRRPRTSPISGTRCRLLQDFRGRIIWRHMQSLNGVDADPLDDTRLQLVRLPLGSELPGGVLSGCSTPGRIRTRCCTSSGSARTGRSRSSPSPISRTSTPRPSRSPGRTTTGWAIHCWATSSPIPSTAASITPTCTPPSR
ncbi:MAG: hypothetical protein U0800_24905 [Isosphaeraceae bacterium]